MKYLDSDRFVVRELTGYNALAVGRASAIGLCVTVIDRAYCATVIRRWTSEPTRAGRGATRAMIHDLIRAEAHALAADLNAK